MLRNFVRIYLKMDIMLTLLVPGENPVNSIIEEFENNFVFKKLEQGLV